MRFIGDVHGRYSSYKKIISQVSESIQVGDMGVGFLSHTNGKYLANPPHAKMVKHNARFIRGNHDNPEVCKKHSQYIPDGFIESTDKNTIMYVGGALSIDKDYRIEDVSWWKDEEISYIELMSIIDTYVPVAPDIMITHEAPELIAEQLFSKGGKLTFPSRTRQAFQIMWELHKPKLWIFGHWHLHKDSVIDDCRFICLAELQYIDLDI
jgi:predicted phosphodiesterase